MHRVANRRPKGIKTADVVRLRIAGKEISEIASTLGVSGGAVRYHLWRDATEEDPEMRKHGAPGAHWAHKPKLSDEAEQPPKPRQAVRTKLLPVWLSESEWEEIRSRLGGDEKQLAATVRRLLLLASR